MENKKILKIVLVLVIILILVDQISKILVEKIMPDETIILQNVLAISKFYNEGIAFGFNKQNITNIALSFLVLVIIIRFIITQRKNLTIKTTVFVSFMIAGGLSNMIDRIFKGTVFDFIQIGDFPIFNLADCFIVIGWVLFVIDVIKNIRDNSE